MEDYVVQYEDTLKKIAEKKLGDENRWFEIAQLNNIQSPYELYVGETIKLPNKLFAASAPKPLVDVEQIPATLAYARGVFFTVFEQLPEIGSDKIVRKIAISPVDLSKHPDLIPKDPLSNITASDHALGNNNSKYLSYSERPYGSPTNVDKGIFERYGNNPPKNAHPMDFVGKYGNQKIRPVIIDTRKLPPGTQIIDSAQLVTFLEQKMKLHPSEGHRISRLIDTIINIESEGLIDANPKNPRVPKSSVKNVSKLHNQFVTTAEKIRAEFKLGHITEQQMKQELKLVSKSYNRVRIAGIGGRVITVIGMVLTAVELAEAGKKSYERNSFKPIVAESIRQTGGWGGAIAGAEVGFLFGAAIGVSSGPGLFISGALGALVFGTAGYIGADWIDDNAVMELRKDVNRVESLRGKAVTLIVGATKLPGENETQYEFSRRALETAAIEAQKETYLPGNRNLPLLFAEKFYPLIKANKDAFMNWQNDNPKLDEK